MEVIRLGDCVGKNGLFSDGDWVESKDQDVNGNVRLIQMADIGVNVFKDKSRRYMTEQKFDELRCTELREGDLLISRMPDPIGRTCIFEGIKQKCATVVDIAILRVDPEIVNNRWLMYKLNSEEIRKKIESQTTGSTRKRISRKKLEDISFDLPSLEVQMNTVKVLEYAQEMINSRMKQIELLDKLTRSIYYEMFGDPVINDKKWKNEKLSLICSKIGSGSTPRGGKSSYKDEGISLIRSMNVHNNQFTIKDLAFISEIQADKLKNVIVEENDVLINITGASVTRSCIVPDSVLPARVNQHVAILRSVKEQVNPIFLLNTLIDRNYQRFLMRIATTGGATREAITKEQLENLSIPVPPIKLQNEFKSKVLLVEYQKELMQQSLAEMENNFNSLMQRAFKGELFN